METCFDYSRCSITSGMPVFVYSSNTKVRPILISALKSSSNLETEPSSACLFVHILSSSQQPENLSETLAHWRGDGRNHLLIPDLTYNLAGNPGDSDIEELEYGRAILAQRFVNLTKFRPNYDLVLPPLNQAGVPVWDVSPSLIPVTRRYLLSYQGQLNKNNLPDYTSNIKQVVSSLEKMKYGKTKDEFLLKFTCDNDARDGPVHPGDWLLCQDSRERKKILDSSTFTLILSGSDPTIISSPSIQNRLTIPASPVKETPSPSVFNSSFN